MKSPINKVRPLGKVVSTASLAIAIAGCSTAYRQKGVNDAREEIRQGKLAVETFGFPGPRSGVYERVLVERYGIETRTVAGCVVDEEILGHAEGFNKTMKKAIKERHGDDVFEKAAAEAKAEQGMTRPSR